MMATAVFYVKQIERLQKIVQSITMSLAVGLMSLTAAGFYLYAYTSLAELKHVSPDDLVRVVAGPHP
jgi:hypothetical protein